MSLLDEIKTQSQITDSVLVSFSMGKDSIVTLDLCMRYFENVQPFFMYLVPNLEFQEEALAKYEKYYGVEILRVPHFEDSKFYRYGSFRTPDLTVPIVKINDIYSLIREATDMHWISGGEKIKDSIVRRAMLKNKGSIDEQRGRFYPLIYWSDKDVMHYIQMYSLILPKFSKEMGFSFHSLAGKELSVIKRLYPNDYKRILKFFPEAEAGVLQYEAYKQGGKK